MDHAVREVRRRFPAALSTPREARHFVGEVLVGHLDDERVGEAALVLSELVTNALMHAATAVDVIVRHDERIWLGVVDGSRELPVPVERPDAAGGRGLHLVDTLCARWGVDVGSDGKCVWCEFERTAPAGEG